MNGSRCLASSTDTRYHMPACVYMHLLTISRAPHREGPDSRLVGYSMRVTRFQTMTAPVSSHDANRLSS